MKSGYKIYLSKDIILGNYSFRFILIDYGGKTKNNCSWLNVGYDSNPRDDLCRLAESEGAMLTKGKGQLNST